MRFYKLLCDLMHLATIGLAQVLLLVLGVCGQKIERHLQIVEKENYPCATPLPRPSSPQHNFRTPPVPGITSPAIGL